VTSGDRPPHHLRPDRRRSCSFWFGSSFWVFRLYLLFILLSCAQLGSYQVQLAPSPSRRRLLVFFSGCRHGGFCPRSPLCRSSNTLFYVAAVRYCSSFWQGQSWIFVYWFRHCHPCGCGGFGYAKTDFV
jgi:hypothetical protein